MVQLVTIFLSLQSHINMFGCKIPSPGEPPKEVLNQSETTSFWARALHPLPFDACNGKTLTRRPDPIWVWALWNNEKQGGKKQWSLERRLSKCVKVSFVYVWIYVTFFFCSWHMGNEIWPFEILLIRQRKLKRLQAQTKPPALVYTLKAFTTCTHKQCLD